ncbi:MAG: restriction endonuclease subunit M [Xanthomonadales bacterium]|nr:restriction endonuclease subunit M [Xanthomonadales bacterium]
MAVSHLFLYITFLLAFLTDENDLAIDPFAGTHKLAMAAENLRRRWLTIEWALDYLRAAMERFRGCPGFASNPQWQLSR